MAAESKIDPMHQFQISALGGGALDGTPFVFTNSALWMLIVFACILVFMWGGMKRELIPGRWQAAVEMLTGFASGLAIGNIGPEGKKYVPWIFTIFTFILFSNFMGMMPFGIVEAARIFKYLASETSGQCGPCVNGLAAIAETMDRIAMSDAGPSDVARVRRWVEMVRGRGACHHPDGAVGLLSSALDVFGDHLTVHFSGRRCHGADVPGFPRPPAPGQSWR